MKYVFFTVLAIMSVAVAAQAAEQKTKIAVGELTCSSCAYIASSAMKAIPSVKIDTFTQDEVNWWEGTFVVTYDNASTTPDMIAEAVMDYGYPASVVTDGGS
jgi:periplasmic mercuric ion binding protein